MTRVARRLIVEGRVQGVGYRWWTVGEATRLGLTGWVRNRTDGSVEALAIGDEAAVDQLTQRCRVGPQGAVVTGLSVTEAVDDGAGAFEQHPTS